MAEKWFDHEDIMRISARALQEAAALGIEDAGHMWRLYRDAKDRLCRRDAEGKEERVPDYPNDLAAAWILLEEMRSSRDGHFTLMSFTTNWRAAPGTIQDPLIESCDMMEGDTPALAITRAFILWAYNRDKAVCDD